MIGRVAEIAASNEFRALLVGTRLRGFLGGQKSVDGGLILNHAASKILALNAARTDAIQLFRGALLPDDRDTGASSALTTGPSQKPATNWMMTTSRVIHQMSSS